jgi:hypothetical protein
MKITSEKQARSLISKIAGAHVGQSIKQSEIKLFVGCSIQTVGNRTRVQGCYYKEITPSGFVDTYGETWAWTELFDNKEDGAILDKYTEKQ